MLAVHEPAITSDPVDYSIIPNSVFDPMKHVDTIARDDAAQTYLTEMPMLLNGKFRKIKEDRDKISFCMDHLRSWARKLAQAEFEKGKFPTIDAFYLWFRERFVSVGSGKEVSIARRLSNIDTNQDLPKLMVEFEQVAVLNDLCELPLDQRTLINAFLRCVRNEVWRTVLNNHATCLEVLAHCRQLHENMKEQQPRVKSFSNQNQRKKNLSFRVRKPKSGEQQLAWEQKSSDLKSDNSRDYSNPARGNYRNNRGLHARVAHFDNTRGEWISNFEADENPFAESLKDEGQ